MFNRSVLFLSLLLLGPHMGPLMAQFWASPGVVGFWNNPANWSPTYPVLTPPAPFPNAPGAFAQFLNNGVPGSTTVTGGGVYTVGNIVLDGYGPSFDYTIDGTLILRLDNGVGGVASISVNPAGVISNHTIDARLFLDSHLNVNFSTGSLTINGTIADGGPTPMPMLSVAGLGTLVLTGNNTFTGSFIASGVGTVMEVQDATGGLQSPTGAASTGNLVSGGAVLRLNGAPGNLNVVEQDMVVKDSMIESGAGANRLNLIGALGLSLIGTTNTIRTTTPGGTLGISAPGGIDLTNTHLDIDTAANTLIRFNGVILSSAMPPTVAITKTGAGTAIFDQINTFDGAVWVQQGVLELQQNDGLGTPTTGNTIDPNATIRLNAPVPSGSVAIFEHQINISGAGFLGQGAISSTQGSNSWTGDIDVIVAATISASGGSNLKLGGGTITLYDDFTTDVAAGSQIDIYNPIMDGTSSYSVAKAGGGTTILHNMASHGGATTISGGVLELAAGGSLSNSVQVTVNTGGTLLLNGVAGDDQVNNTADIILNGGTLNGGGISGQTESLGILTLSASSVLDLGTATSYTIRFDDSSSVSWSGTLEIWNWSGTPGVAGGIDQVYFGTGLTMGLTLAQLSQIQFYSDSGTTALGSASFVGSLGEITPTAVPEPTTLVGAAFLLGLVFWRERRWLMRCAEARAFSRK